VYHVIIKIKKLFVTSGTQAIKLCLRQQTRLYLISKSHGVLDQMAYVVSSFLGLAYDDSYSLV
jgi:hypothetical protein